MQISALNTFNNVVTFIYMQRKNSRGEKKTNKQQTATVKNVAINCSQFGNRHIVFEDALCVSLRKGWKSYSIILHYNIIFETHYFP